MMLLDVALDDDVAGCSCSRYQICLIRQTPTPSDNLPTYIKHTEALLNLLAAADPYTSKLHIIIYRTKCIYNLKHCCISQQAQSGLAACCSFTAHSIGGGIQILEPLDTT